MWVSKTDGNAVKGDGNAVKGTVGLRTLAGPRRLGSIAVVAALFAAGCSSGDDGAEQPTAVTEPSTTSTTPATPAAEDTTTSTTQAPATTATQAPSQAPSTTATTEAPRPEASTLDRLLELDRPLVIAHAGGDQDYPHSTIYAYTQAAAVGADILELDVQLTADGVLIVQHDDTVDRTTEATGPVAELTLSEVKALDNAYWFLPGRWGDQTRPDEEYVFRGVRTGEVEPPPGFGPDDFSVATFREVAERFPNHVLDVEIKLQSGPDGEPDLRTGLAAAEVLAAEIAELGREQSVIVASFNDETLAAMNELAPGVATSPGLNAMLAWFLSGEPLDPRYRVLQVPLTFEGVEVVDPELIGRVHDEGRHVWVWLSGTDVVETSEFYAELLERGVDGLIAGRPASAVDAISR